MKVSRLNWMALGLILTLAACTAMYVQAGTTGIIKGTVKDAETGELLSGVNVMISGTKLTTVTDDAGRFVITNVPPGDYEVTADLVGYAQGVVDSISVTMDATNEFDIDLQTEVAVEDTAVISRPKPMIDPAAVNTLSAVTAQQEELTRTDPASVRSITGVLSTQPGVLVDPTGSGQVYVRGGKPDQAGWYVEGIPITDPNTGMFGTNIYTTGMSKLQAYTGGFGAEFGNAISGVLNEVIKTGGGYPGTSLQTETGSSALRNGFIEFGGGTPDTFNYYVGSAAMQGDLDGPVVKYQDYSDNVAKLVWPSENNTYTVLALQGSLYGKLDGKHTETDLSLPIPEENDFMRQRYNVAAFTWSHNFTPESFLNIRPYYMYTTVAQNMMGGTMGLPFFLNVASERKGLQVDYANQLNDMHLLKLGGSLLGSDNNYYMYAVYPGMGVFAPYNFRADVNTFQTALFAEDQMKLSDKWNANVGLRFDSIEYDRKGLGYVADAGYTGDPVPDTKESIITPRLGFSYAQDAKTAWKFNWGRYAKFVPSNVVQRIYFDPDNADFMPEAYAPGVGLAAPEKSTAWEVSYEKQFNDSFAMRLTPFVTEYDNLAEQYTDGNGVSQYVNVGQGESKGAEILLRKKLSDNWQGWLSYTYQKTKYNKMSAGNLSSLYYSSWDQRQTISMVAAYTNGNWGHSLRADFGSGRADSATAVDASLQDHANPYVILSYNLTVDLPENSAIGDSIYLSIYNLLNNDQALHYSWSGAPSRDLDAWVPQRSISFGVNKSF